MIQPTISVVMSVYNAEKFLHQAVQSILNQTFTDFEFIIIEDCSTDNSLAILEDFAQKDNRIKLIQKTENKGVAGFIENLNIGLKKAKGKYIARMDADDISHPSRFEKQVDFLEKNPDIFMVGSSINLIDENGDFIKNLNGIELDYNIKKRMVVSPSMYHPVIMFRNHEGLFYNQKMYYCEDQDLYLRAMNKGKKFYNIQSVLLDYRIINNSITRNNSYFIKGLFVEKARIFYHQKNNIGQNSYCTFSSLELESVLNPCIKTKREYLVFALHRAIEFNCKEEFSKLIQKYQHFYNKDFFFYFFKIIDIFPYIFTKIYIKLVKIISYRKL